MALEELPTFLPKTDNDFALHVLLGGVKRIGQGVPFPPQFTNRHEAFRYAAWLVSMAEMLPEEHQQEGITFEDVLHAVRNT